MSNQKNNQSVFFMHSDARFRQLGLTRKPHDIVGVTGTWFQIPSVIRATEKLIQKLDAIDNSQDISKQRKGPFRVKTQNEVVLSFNEAKL